MGAIFKQNIKLSASKFLLQNVGKLNFPRENYDPYFSRYQFTLIQFSIFASLQKKTIFSSNSVQLILYVQLHALFIKTQNSVI